MLRENAISTQIIGCAIEVHRTLGGPGLLESVQRGLSVGAEAAYVACRATAVCSNRVQRANDG